MPARLTTDQEREIARRYRSGEPGTSVAQALGISRTAVYSALERLQVPCWGKLSPQQRTAIVAAVARGESLRAIARRYDVAHTTVWTIAKKHRQTGE